MSISDKVHDYVEEIQKELLNKGLRGSIDNRNESLKKKVRDAQLKKVPCILTLGEKEKEAKTISVRTLKGNIKFAIPLADFINQCLEMVSTKTGEMIFDK